MNISSGETLSNLKMSERMILSLIIFLFIRQTRMALLFISCLFCKGDKKITVVESSEYICCEINILQWISFSDIMFDQRFHVYRRMVISLDAPFICSAPVSKNCSGTPGVKPFSTLPAKLGCSLFVQWKPFLIGKP